MALQLLGAIAGGALGLIGANKAAKAQQSAVDTTVGLQRKIYGDTTNRLDPFTGAGTSAVNALRYNLGLGDQPIGYEGISMSPSGQFLLEEGRDTIEAGAAARGGLHSGATLKALEGERSRIATLDRDNQLNRLMALSQIGQASASGQSAAGTNFAAGAGNAILQGGNARAAGIIGGVNAATDTINNVIGYQQMNRLAA